MGERTARHHDRRAVHERLVAELTDAATQRHLREDLVNGPTGYEPGWVRYERSRMLAVVNEERAKRGLQPVAWTTVAEAESAAAGHVDYVTKYALYCAELVVDKP